MQCPYVYTLAVQLCVCVCVPQTLVGIAKLMTCVPQTLVGIAKLMKECWHHNPMVRLSALRLKKSLVRLEGTAGGCKPENVVKIDV